MEEPGFLAAKVSAVRRAVSSWGIPPVLKLGALIGAGIAPFAIFVTFQTTSTRGAGGQPEAKPAEQLPVEQRVPLAFPFGNPEPPPKPTTTTSRPQVAAVSTAAPQCANGRDDDGDKKVDLRDPGCSSRSDNNEREAVRAPTTRRVPPPATTTVPVTAPPTTATTIPPTVPVTAPPQTVTTTSRTTRVVLGECSDGIDNDGDKKIDAADRASCALGPQHDE